MAGPAPARVEDRSDQESDERTVRLMLTITSQQIDAMKATLEDGFINNVTSMMDSDDAEMKRSFARAHMNDAHRIGIRTQRDVARYILIIWRARECFDNASHGELINHLSTTEARAWQKLDMAELWSEAKILQKKSRWK